MGTVIAVVIAYALGVAFADKSKDLAARAWASLKAKIKGS